MLRRLLVLLFAVTLRCQAVDLPGSATTRAVRESADEFKAASKKLGTASEAIPPAAADLEAFIHEARPVLPAIQEAAVEIKAAAAELRAAAMTYRGKAPDGGPAKWVVTWRRWRWLALIVPAIPALWLLTVVLRSLDHTLNADDKATMKEKQRQISRIAQWVINLLLHALRLFGKK